MAPFIATMIVTLAMLAVLGMFAAVGADSRPTIGDDHAR
jgi:hypothetical protein